jgi:hypothetical protein
MAKGATKNNYDNKDDKNKSFKDLHPLQQEGINRLLDKSKELNCEIENVRDILINRLFLEKCKDFKATNEVYLRAVEVGFGNALLRCAEAQLKIIAQSIINTQYPSYNDNGELRGRPLGYSCDAAPHLDYSKDKETENKGLNSEPEERGFNKKKEDIGKKLKEFIRKIYQEQELDLSKEVREAVWKKWVYLKENKFNQPQEINLKKM